MKIFDKPIRLEDIWKQKESAFDEMLKAVADVQNNILAVDAEMHSDLEAALLENGSHQENLWGLNIYPMKEKNGNDFIEFTSFINIRPSRDNPSMEVLDPIIRGRIKSLVQHLLL